MQPEASSPVIPYDTVTTSQQHQTTYARNNRPLSEIRNPSYHPMSITQSNRNIRTSLVTPYQFNPMEQSQTVNRSS